MKRYITYNEQDFDDWIKRFRVEISWMLKDTIMRDNNWSQEDAIDAAFKKMLLELK